MTSLFEEFRRAFSDPAMRHAALVHLPVAMAMLGVVVALVAAVTPRNRRVRLVATAWFLVMALAAFMATRSGERAEGALPPNLPEVVYERLDRHQEMGEKVWIFAVATAGLFILSLASAPVVRVSASALALGGAIACAGWTGVTAHHGGILVYEHGLGTPCPGSRRPPPREARSVESTGNEGSERTAWSGSEDGEGDAEARSVHLVEGARSILEANCQSCHNSVRPKARLDLTSRAGMLRGGRSGQPAIVPGQPEESLMLALVRGTHPTLDRMPPDEPLAVEDIAILERWILDGATWEVEP